MLVFLILSIVVGALTGALLGLPVLRLLARHGFIFSVAAGAFAMLVFWLLASPLASWWVAAPLAVLSGVFVFAVAKAFTEMAAIILDTLVVS